MEYKNILRIVPGLQATAIAVKNIPEIDMKAKTKDFTPKKMVKLGMFNIIGIGMLKPTAKMIEDL